MFRPRWPKTWWWSAQHPAYGEIGAYGERVLPRRAMVVTDDYVAWASALGNSRVTRTAVPSHPLTTGAAWFSLPQGFWIMCHRHGGLR